MDQFDFSNSQVHASCRVNFRTKLDSYREKHGTECGSNSENVAIHEKNSETHRETRSMTKDISVEKKFLCFVCGEERVVDTNSYMEGGLGRCSHVSSAEKLLEGMRRHVNEEVSPMQNAAKRLQMLNSGQAHDIFAIDVYYHHSCYLRFTRSSRTSQSSTLSDTQQLVEAEFLTYVKIKIMLQKNAYLLNELLHDIASFSEEHSLEPFISNTRTLRRFLEKKFSQEIGFFPFGKQVIVYSADTNPCQYAVLTLQGAGLRDRDLTKAFATLVRKQVKPEVEKESCEEQWPMSPETLLEKFQRGPPTLLYNTIYLTLYGTCTYNEYGYAETQSSNISNKIWSIASDWAALLGNQKSPKQIMLSIGIHRLSASKEIVTLLNKAGHGISYNDIRLQNEHWAKTTMGVNSIYRGLSKGAVTHSSVDNNDFRNETSTGHGTAHHTNSLIFQPRLTGEIIKIKIFLFLNP